MTSSSSSATSAFALGALAGTAAGYGLALYLVPRGGIASIVPEGLDGVLELFAELKASAVKGISAAAKKASSSSSSSTSEPTTAATAAAASANSNSTKAHPLKGDDDDPKMVLLVRRDLEMGKGKTGAQCAHAAVGLYKSLRRSKDERLKEWEAVGATKVALRVSDERELLAVAEAARRAGLPHHVVVDAGRTQVAAGSRTVLSVLGRGSEVDKLTGRLKLL